MAKNINEKTNLNQAVKKCLGDCTNCPNCKSKNDEKTLDKKK